MKIGVRTQIFGVSALLIVALGVTGVLLTDRVARGILEGRSTTDLLAEARLARSLLRARSPTEAGEVATELSRATGAEVVILEGPPDAPRASALRIVADSTGQGMGRDTLAELPEVRAAWAGGEGTWLGSEPCVGGSCPKRGLAVATLWRDDASTGMIRLRRDLSEIDADVATLREVVGLASLLGLGVALFMSGLASRVLSRTLTELVRRARAMARGEGGKLAIPDDEALGGLAGSINELGVGLERTVRDLARQRDLQRTVLEGLHDAVIALDGELRIITANRAAIQMLSLPENPDGLALIEAARYPALLSLVRKRRVEAQTHEVEIELTRPTRRRVLATAHPLGGQGCVLVLRDVTEARKLETMRRDFVANASHELRTPVAAIQASVEALCDGAVHDERDRPAFLDAVRRNALRLSHVVDDLLDLSRLDSGPSLTTTTALQLAPVVEDALASARPAFESKRIRVEACVEPGLSVRADRNALDQILANLLDNAAKYTPHEGRVRVEALSDGHQVRVAVHDSGPGVPIQHRSRIFERFYRVDTARSRALGGTGLGLAIVKHLVERMEGEVTLECPEIGGSVFSVLLRRAE